MSTSSTTRTDSVGTSHPAEQSRTPLSARLGRFSAVFLFLGFVAVFSITIPETFLTGTTWRLTLSEGVVTAIIALAFLVPLAAGVFDLSVGTMLGMSLVIMNWFGINKPDLSPWLVALLAMGTCALFGLLSGVLIVRFKVNSLIATLGVSQVLLAIQLKISNNRQMTGAFDQGWASWGTREIVGVPIVIFYLLALAVLLWFILEHTPIGRYMFAVGGNPVAARLSGLNVGRITYGTLAASGAIAGFAGVVFSMKVGTYSSSTGPSLLFPALAAVFFGASQFSGRTNVWGTLVAYFALAFGVKGLQLGFGPGTFWIQPLFQGAALLIAVALASREIGQVKATRRPQRPGDKTISASTSRPTSDM